MKSRATSRFWASHGQHPSLQFKKVDSFWSARITDDYRALGVLEGDTVIWFWIGPTRNTNGSSREDRTE
jgi:hypothetical protein